MFVCTILPLMKLIAMIQIRAKNPFYILFAKERKPKDQLLLEIKV